MTLLREIRQDSALWLLAFVPAYLNIAATLYLLPPRVQ